MTDNSHRTLERIARRVPVPEPAYERLLRRRDRKERNRRISAGALAIVVALVSFAALTRALHNGPRPADERTPKPPGIFSEVGGWITYGNGRGIRAVDSTRPEDASSQIRLSTDGGTPLAWSSDGSKLLILRCQCDFPTLAGYDDGRSLVVLNANGTETRLAQTHDRQYVNGGSFSSDGSRVVYAIWGGKIPSSIYVIDAEGGTPRKLLTAGFRYPDPGDKENGPFRTGLYYPTFSPDGTKIAYFDGFGDNSHSLRVVDADGGDMRVLVRDMEAYRISNLAWSPDGTRLAFGRIHEGIYTIGVDGSGLTLVIPDGVYPHWSPDGSRISYEPYSYPPNGPLHIAAADGTQVVGFDFGGSGPWNPLVQPESEVAEVPAASGGATFDTQLVWGAVVLLAIGATLLAIWRRKRGRLSRPSAQGGAI
jgi:Tol biopolymer transport system component